MKSAVEQFRQDCLNEIDQQASNEKLKSLSRDWFDASAATKYSYHFEWMGRPIIAYPQDMIAMQEIVWRVKPDLIVETGVAHGGSIVFYASLLELLGHGEVLGIDIDIRPHNRAAIEAHPMFKRIRLMQGSSIDPQVVSDVHEAASGKRVLVVLDSNHTHDHVLAELRAYASLVAVGSYCVVMDTCVENMPTAAFSDRPWSVGNNPMTALHAYLAEDERFKVDSGIDSKILISVAPSGYLLRVR